MSNPTSNFGWQMPTPTDLVTDLPADFEVFGQAVDTSLADLKGGTTGQVLSKATNADMDFTWVAPTAGDIEGVTAGVGISGGGTSGTVTITNDMATTITASGDIVVGTGSGTYDNLPIGTTGQVLTADTTVSPYKVKWATPSTPSSGATLINRTAFSASSGTTIDNLFSASYERYLVKVAVYGSSAGATFGIQGRYSTTTYTTADYKYAYRGLTTGGAAADTSSGGVGAWYFPAIIGTASTALSIMDINIYRTNGSNYLFQTTTGWDNNGSGYAGAGVIPSSQTWTGLHLFASAGTITGNVSIYGLASA